MDERTLSDLLRRFGLSDKEVDTYLTLLEHGEAKASTIADAAGVSKRYVYSVSEALEKRGFVEVNDHVVPTTIRANPPGEVIEGLRADVDAMRSGLEERFTETEPASEQFEVIKSRVTVIKRIKALIDAAESELTLSIPIEHLDEVVAELRDAVDRGVLVLLILTGADEAPDLDGVASVARAWREPMPTMLTVDAALGVVAPTEMVVRSNSDRQAIVFAQEQLGPVIVGSFFGNYWPVAEEVATADPVELPVTYETFRHAVFQAILHHRSGTELRVRVAGRSTVDDERIELEGDLIEVKQGMVHPSNNDFPVQHSIVIDTPDGEVTVGGPGAFIEDIEADLVTLERA